MSELSRKVGYKIKTLRRARELTQSELAEQVDIDAKYLSRIETGLSYPSLRTIEKIVKVLNADIGYLFDFSEYKAKEDIQEELIRKIETYPLDKLKLLASFSNIIDTKEIKS